MPNWRQSAEGLLGRWRVVQRRLGRGLDFLISGPSGGGNADEVVLQVPLAEIVPNRYQPRREFAEAELAELAASILEHGVLQPVVVRTTEEGYELIAGERRFRACQRIGRETVPAVVRQASDDQMLELALIENLQREQLNAIEVALGYQALMERLHLTQEDVALRVGKSRSGVANTLRLLDLPTDLQSRVAAGELSGGHARALLALGDADAQRALAERAATEGLSVREVESAVRRLSKPKPVEEVAPVDPSLAPYFHDLEDQLREALGTRVTLVPRGEKGRIVIEYFSREELEGVLDRLLATAGEA